MSKLRKVLLAGGPSSGKTTLANEVNVLLKMAGRRSEIVPEYARAYIAQCGLPRHAYEQQAVFTGQLRAEQQLAEHAEYLICDSATWFCYVYARKLRPVGDDAEEWAKYRHVLHELWLATQEQAGTYTDVFFLPSQLPVRGDGLRHDAAFALDMERRLRGYLDSEGIAYTVVTGPLKKRADIVMSALGVPMPKVVRLTKVQRAVESERPA